MKLGEAYLTIAGNEFDAQLYYWRAEVAINDGRESTFWMSSDYPYTGKMRALNAAANMLLKVGVSRRAIVLALQKAMTTKPTPLEAVTP